MRGDPSFTRHGHRQVSLTPRRRGRSASRDRRSVAAVPSQVNHIGVQEAEMRRVKQRVARGRSRRTLTLIAVALVALVASAAAFAATKWPNQAKEIATSGIDKNIKFCGTKPITLAVEDGLGLNAWSRGVLRGGQVDGGAVQERHGDHHRGQLHPQPGDREHQLRGRAGREGDDADPGLRRTDCCRRSRRRPRPASRSSPGVPMRAPSTARTTSTTSTGTTATPERCGRSGWSRRCTVTAT